MKGNGRDSAKMGPVDVLGILGLSAAMVGGIMYGRGYFDE